MTQEPFTYKQAGVDIEAASSLKRRIVPLARSTFSANVVQDIGLFGGLFRFDSARYREPILVSSVDGVGTKLKIAFVTGRHNTVGIDLVSHCVNDILMQGAEALFFLDYLAMGKLDVDIAEQVISGLAEGCRAAGCSLIGGETAEMPDFYQPGEYDLAGTIIGVVDKHKIIDGSAIRKDDVIVAVQSSGLHTNGYSLVRKLLVDSGRYRLDQRVDALGKTLADELLEPHRCYARAVRGLLDKNLIRGMAHITGGGLTDNVPRVLPKAVDAEINMASLRPLSIFQFIQQEGDIDEGEMLRTFNMGVGMVVIVSPADEEETLSYLDAQGETVWTIGRIVSGTGKVKYRR
ncbi:MAG: phosphoribosylformylglycinamidine cyclo-ligase [Candidatus Abyssobacteria bacterium SURF_5]|uniref:Phosphoribosylformylglycinamidine cyclo-ligase n=1 Tax=Abyssobacteria bacterium (strain SURF_5) TaxID=2093360 RepID=A0A3A4P6V5_ABYX5|nr:MAG: phosphoribosylformylglycinamidine cyclo-ligase [Candidatus Abyssubacteria bacterium SURF_5]